MNYPALIIHSVNGNPVSVDILHNDQELASYPAGTEGVERVVIPLSRVMEAAKCEYPLNLFGEVVEALRKSVGLVESYAFGWREQQTPNEAADLSSDIRSLLARVQIVSIPE